MYSVEEKYYIIIVSLLFSRTKHMSTVVKIKKNDTKTWNLSIQMSVTPFSLVAFIVCLANIGGNWRETCLFSSTNSQNCSVKVDAIWIFKVSNITTYIKSVDFIIFVSFFYSVYCIRPANIAGRMKNLKPVIKQ